MLAVAIILVASPGWSGDGPSKSLPDAHSVYRDYLQPYSGTPQAVQQNLVAPMVNAAPMKSVDGKNKFSASTLHASGTPLLRVTAMLNANTGDLAGITVEQDMTGSGRYNSASVFPNDGNGKAITSICSNGYVQCDAGSFRGCQYRSWTADQTGKIGAEVAGPKIAGDTAGSIDALSSCYCFNHSCSHNNSAILSLDNIAADAAAGILTAFMSANQGLTITGTQNSGSGAITYFGIISREVVQGGDSRRSTIQSAANMPVFQTTDMAALQSYYMSSPASFDALAAVALQAQQGMPDSIFKVTNTAMSKQLGTRIQCQKRRLITLNQATKYCEDKMVPDSTVSSTDSTKTTVIWSLLSQSPDKYYGFKVKNPSNHSRNRNDCNCHNLTTYCAPLSGLPSTPVTVQEVDIRYMDTLAPFAHFDGRNAGAFFDRYKSWEDNFLGRPALCSYYYFDYYYICQRYIEYDKEEIADTCPYLESRTESGQCRLEQELVDRRPSVVNYMPTAFPMAQVFNDYNGIFRSYRLYRDWFEINRSYFCNSEPPSYNFDDIQQQSKGVRGSANMPDNQTMAYDSNGKHFSYAVFPKTLQFPGCQQVCKTKIPAPQSAVTNYAVKSAGQSMAGVTESSYFFYYKTCNEQPLGGMFVCPTDPTAGEIIVTDCSCSGEIGEAIGAISAINGAARDMICAPN